VKHKCCFLTTCIKFSRENSPDGCPSGLEDLAQVKLWADKAHISHKLPKITLPHDFKRKFRPVEEFHKWKASEKQALFLQPVKPYLWLRYIDDVLMIWTAGEQSLLEFLQWINQLHENIKFTWDWSKRTINYLDVQIINNNGVIETDLYTKPTDKHQYLFHTSFHPKGVKQSIPYV